jgi:hypothetical protein
MGSLAIVVIAVACGGDGATIGAHDAGASEGGPGADGSTPDGGTNDAASNVDSASFFDAAACSGLQAREVTACEKASDCDIVYRGCYCGQQPAVGVATAFSMLMAACEQKAAQECALGCATLPGHIAQDGKNDADGGAVNVRCDSSGPGKGTCRTYIP